MAKYDASTGELEDLWKQSEQLWKNLKEADPTQLSDETTGGMLDYPWIKSSFIAGTFKTLLAQKGWRIDSSIKGGFR